MKEHLQELKIGGKEMTKKDYIKLINRLLEQMEKKDVKRIWKCLLDSLIKVEND